MPILMKLRGPDLDMPRAEEAIATTRDHVTVLLCGDKDMPERDIDFGPAENFAMTVLARRLNHIGRSAAKVAHLAARPVIHDEAHA